METIDQCSASEEAHGSAKSRQQQALPSAKPPEFNFEVQHH
jgi:hypothetical protein